MVGMELLLSFRFTFSFFTGFHSFYIFRVFGTILPHSSIQLFAMAFTVFLLHIFDMVGILFSILLIVFALFFKMVSEVLFIVNWSVFALSNRITKPVNYSRTVFALFFCRSPSQIARSVVVANSIYMVYCGLVFRVIVECLADKSMHLVSSTPY